MNDATPFLFTVYGLKCYQIGYSNLYQIFVETAKIVKNLIVHFCTYLYKNWWKMPRLKNSNVIYWVIFKHCVNCKMTVRKNPAIPNPVVANPPKWIPPNANLPKTESRLTRIAPKLNPASSEPHRKWIPLNMNPTLFKYNHIT